MHKHFNRPQNQQTGAHIYFNRRSETSRPGRTYISMKTIRGAFYGGEIHGLRRLRREGIPERLSRS